MGVVATKCVLHFGSIFIFLSKFISILFSCMFSISNGSIFFIHVASGSSLFSTKVGLYWCRNRSRGSSQINDVTDKGDTIDECDWALLVPLRMRRPPPPWICPSDRSSGDEVCCIGLWSLVYCRGGCAIGRGEGPVVEDTWWSEGGCFVV